MQFFFATTEENAVN